MNHVIVAHETSHGAVARVIVKPKGTEDVASRRGHVGHVPLQ